MTKQQLNGAHVGAGFQQMNCETVPKGMRCDRFSNPAKLMRLLAGYLYRSLLMWSATRSPGKSHRFGLFTGHQVRRIWSSFGESMTSRSFCPYVLVKFMLRWQQTAVGKNGRARWWQHNFSRTNPQSALRNPMSPGSECQGLVATSFGRSQSASAFAFISRSTSA